MLVSRPWILFVAVAVAALIGSSCASPTTTTTTSTGAGPGTSTSPSAGASTSVSAAAPATSEESAQAVQPQSVRVFLENFLTFRTSMMESAATADLSDPRFDDYNDAEAAAAMRSLIESRRDEQPTLRGLGQQLEDGFIAWRSNDTEGGIGILYCALKHPDFGFYDEAGNRVDVGPAEVRENASFNYLALTPAETELGWRVSGGMGLWIE